MGRLLEHEVAYVIACRQLLDGRIHKAEGLEGYSGGDRDLGRLVLEPRDLGGPHRLRLVDPGPRVCQPNGAPLLRRDLVLLLLLRKLASSGCAPLQPSVAAAASAASPSTAAEVP